MLRQGFDEHLRVGRLLLGGESLEDPLAHQPGGRDAGVVGDLLDRFGLVGSSTRSVRGCAPTSATFVVGVVPVAELTYDDFAFNPLVAPTLIAEDLGVTADPDEVWRLVTGRRTRKRVARPHRYRTDMSPDDAARIERAFPEYLALVEHHDLGWFQRPAPDPGPLPWDLGVS